MESVTAIRQDEREPSATFRHAKTSNSPPKRRRRYAAASAAAKPPRQPSIDGHDPLRHASGDLQILSRRPSSQRRRHWTQNAVFDVIGRHRQTRETTTTRLRSSSPPRDPLRSGRSRKVRSDRSDAKSASHRVSRPTICIRSRDDQIGPTTPDCRTRLTPADVWEASVPRRARQVGPWRP